MTLLGKGSQHEDNQNPNGKNPITAKPILDQLCAISNVA